jgi:cell division protein FtsB
MNLFREIRRRSGGLLAQVLGCLLVAYFAYHLTEGDRGYFAWIRLAGELAEAKQALAAVDRDRQALEARVSLLRPDNLDPDLLDERARVMLNLATPGEIVVPRAAAAPVASILSRLPPAQAPRVPRGSLVESDAARERALEMQRKPN